MRILVVDDDYTSRTQLKSLLAAYGDCDVAPGGEAALLLFRDALESGLPYELVTLDIEMPGMDGKKVLELLRAQEEKLAVPAPKRSKVLMVTVKNRLKDVSESYNKECSGYIVKPATPQSLKEALKETGLA